MSNNTRKDLGWATVKESLEGRLAKTNEFLASECLKVTTGFASRITYTKGQSLRSKLTECNDALASNFSAAQRLLEAVKNMMTASDESIRSAGAGTKTHLPGTEYADFREGVELVLTANALASVMPYFNKAFSCCALLIVILGHREARAHEYAALRELVGAIGDPGLGIPMLFKRLVAVLTGTIRGDQDADEVFESLEEFRQLMGAWKGMVIDIGEGVDFDVAGEKAFAKWLIT